MPTPKQPSEHPNWEQLIGEYRKSGLGVKKWCEKNNVPFFKFRYRLYNQEDRKSDTGMGSSEWLQATVTSSVAGAEESTGLTVKLGKVAIEVRPGFDENLFSSVVRVLLAL